MPTLTKAKPATKPVTKPASTQRILRFSAATSKPVEVTSVDGKPRSWIMLLPIGTIHDRRYGEVTVDRKLCDALERNFERGARRIDIALDVDHDASQATGWLERVEFREGQQGQPAGLWGLVRWTPYGAQLLSDEIYKYFSAEFDPNYTDEHEHEWGPTILGGALTNRPVMKDMPAVTLAEVSRKPWGSVNKSKLPRSCFLIQGDPNDKSTWKLPVYEGAGPTDAEGHYTKRGALNINAVRAALAAIGGARQDSPMAGVPASVKSRLAGWMKRYGASSSETTDTSTKNSERPSTTSTRKVSRVKNAQQQQRPHDHDEDAVYLSFADVEDEGDEEELAEGGAEDEGEEFAEDDGSDMEYDEGEDRHGPMTTKSHTHGKYGSHSHDGDADHSDAPLADDAEDAADGGVDEDTEMSDRGSRTGARSMMGAPGLKTKRTLAKKMSEREALALREEVAQLRYKLYEGEVEKTLANWERQTYTFKDGKTSRQGRIALSKSFKEAVRRFMLSGEVLRLSERGRKDVLALCEQALSTAIVDLERRATSFDQESRRTLKAGQKLGNVHEQSDRLQETAVRLAESEYGKSIDALDAAQQIAIYERAAQSIGYR